MDQRLSPSHYNNKQLSQQNHRRTLYLVYHTNTYRTISVLCKRIKKKKIRTVSNIEHIVVEGTV